MWEGGEKWVEDNGVETKKKEASESFWKLHVISTYHMPWKWKVILSYPFDIHTLGADGRDRKIVMIGMTTGWFLFYLFIYFVFIMSPC